MQYDIITVLHDSTEPIRAFLDSLSGTGIGSDHLHLFFAVSSDSESVLSELAQLKQEFDRFADFNIIDASCEKSLSAAKNRAAFQGTSPFLFFLCPDAQIAPDVFDTAESTASSAPSAAVFECRALPFETSQPCDPVTLCTDFVCSDALFVRRTAFEQIGGFEPRFQDDDADRDFSLRLRAANFSLQYMPNACVSFARRKDAFGAEQYANSLCADLLTQYKFGSLREILHSHAAYLDAVRHPVHFDGVRRVLAKTYLHHFRNALPLMRWRSSHKSEFSKAAALRHDALHLDRGRFAVPDAHGTPLVSVIVRTCSRPDTLRRTLQSLRNQTYRNFEIIVAEDGAPVSRPMLEREFADLPICYLNDGIRYGRAENGNRALAAAHGSLCNFLDDDDFFYPDHLELLVHVLEQHPTADLVLGSAAAMFVDRSGKVTELRPMVFDRIDRFTMCQDCRIPIQTVLFRRSLFEQYGGMPAELDAHEDWAMWLKYLEHAHRITPHKPDVCRITSLFVQPADEDDAAARIAAYSKSDDAFYHDETLRFDVSIADLRRYYDDMIRDMRCLEQRGELHDFLTERSKRYEP